MKIELYKPLSIFGQGSRDNMEDCIFPSPGRAKETDTFFIVCDGMGGHAKGETASNLACDSLAEYFTLNPPGQISEQYFLDAFDYIQTVFDSYLKEHKEAGGMGTTLVMLYLNQDAVAVMHCGDSRFYHFRNPDLLWKTNDHKLVNEFVKQGLITEEEAVNHPKKNIITRAIQGNDISKIKPDISFINQPMEGDYFLLCTDGLYESISDVQLGEILSSASDEEEKIRIIRELCEGNSKDNYSAFLLKIKVVE
jgi:serine/threonine protein phosphatase PrpC